jgi:predicted amidohydrolase YtcJ
VLSRNPLMVPPTELLDVEVMATVSRGRLVYGDL